MGSRNEQALHEIIFADCPPRDSLAAAALRFVGGQGGSLDKPLVGQSDHHVLLGNQVRVVDLLGSFFYGGSSVIPETIAEIVDVFPYDFRHDGLIGENFTVVVDLFTCFCPDPPGASLFSSPVSRRSCILRIASVWILVRTNSDISAARASSSL